MADLAKFHPSIPASGEDCPLQAKIFRENFNILALVKKNLTALLFSLRSGENNKIVLVRKGIFSLNPQL